MSAVLPPPLPWLQYKRGRRQVWLILGLGVGLPLIAVILLGWLFISWMRSPAPTVDQLRDTFHTHRAEFERLIAMMGEEREIVEVHTEWVRLQNQPSQWSDMGQDRQRLRQYRQLLKALHLQSISREFDGFSLTAWAGGAMPDDGEYLGYKYFFAGHGPTPERPLVQSFTGSGHVPRGATEYVPIEGPWHFYYLY